MYLVQTGRQRAALFKIGCSVSISIYIYTKNVFFINLNNKVIMRDMFKLCLLKQRYARDCLSFENNIVCTVKVYQI